MFDNLAGIDGELAGFLGNLLGFGLGGGCWNQPQVAIFGGKQNDVGDPSEGNTAPARPKPAFTLVGSYAHILMCS